MTGAARGIGFGIARMLAEAGATVAVNDLDAVPAEEAAAQLGGDCFAVPGNVTSEAAAHPIVAGVVDRGHDLDFLVNNAGVAAPLVPLADLSSEDWQHVIDVNLKGAFLMSQAAAAVMRGGCIVNVASVAGLVGFPASHAYGVSKAAVVMLTKTLATELARRRVRVNAVAPGLIEAPMLDVMIRNSEDSDALAARIPMGRLGSAEEVGRVVAFLCSDSASYITGAVLPVDGGWQAFGAAGPASRPGGPSC
ncbi:NAD(P)-dependent dehydrogenase (short-subunit alcohol dehydrogenase family) [Sphingopyxis sp. JAI128]|nr:NAD(P)-dependent dehydrogenase (short-subunit alcohol dehydrogenase family) [Sphingopyxis sp. JAI128]